MGRRRSAEIPISGEVEDDRSRVAEAEDGEEGKGFFACYLLCSLSPRFKGHTYIGFTVDPRRRIRQHNGEITSGAWRTKRKRPWEMILCIYGFPTNVNALQFEWAWQHPRESLAVRKAAESFKSLSGIANKIKIAYTMLTLPSWENFNLTVNFFSTKYMRYTVGCPSIPRHMKVNVRVMDELPCYVDGQMLDDDNDGVCEDEEGMLLESVHEPLDQYEDDGYVKEDTVSEDQSEKQGCDVSRCQVNSFIQNPGETYGIYSWQINTVPHPNLMDYCHQTPTKQVDRVGSCGSSFSASSCSDSADQSIHSDVTASIEPSTPTTSGADNNVRNNKKCLSPDSDVINLVTPSSCINHSKDKQIPTCRKFIDLTDSPEVIHL